MIVGRFLVVVRIWRKNWTRMDGHEVLRKWYVVVQEEEETVYYIPGRRIVMGVMLHKIFNLR